MSFALSMRLPRSGNIQMLCAAFGLMVIAICISSFHRRPRPWDVSEVPIAFWSWRNQTPSAEDVRAAIDKTKARAIFLRAGQIDFQEGKLGRIRSVNGAYPHDINLHLVYNATHAVLSQLDNVEERELASAIAAAFHEDCDRAEQDHARVVGVQVDIDFPTRLLGKYETALHDLHSQIPRDKQLSITGLPTWMESSRLPTVLRQVDFWIPQFYGAEIPTRADQMIPISSPQSIAGFVDSARQLNKPFYAGLAAYGCALLYDSTGSLIELRGDMDPATIAADSNLELIHQRPFEFTGPQFNRIVPNEGEWRYAYRARADGVIDHLVAHAGDLLVIDAQTTESLRAAARTVRQLAGEKLLGICVFRLPAQDDPATLNSDQVSTALADRESAVDIKVKFTRANPNEHTWVLEIENAGTAGAVEGLSLDFEIDPGAVESATSQAGESVALMCQVSSNDNTPVFEPCSGQRANLIRLKAPSLNSRQLLRAKLILRAVPPRVLFYSVETKSDTGERYVRRSEVVTQLE